MMFQIVSIVHLATVSTSTSSGFAVHCRNDNSPEALDGDHGAKAKRRQKWQKVNAQLALVISCYHLTAPHSLTFMSMPVR